MIGGAVKERAKLQNISTTYKKIKNIFLNISLMIKSIFYSLPQKRNKLLHSWQRKK